jgi:two-component sensor histidine kinase
VHERLYRDAKVKAVDLSTYLTDICDDLREVTSPCEIDFKASERIYMGTDRAVLAALLVGELVTNAAKHAYPVGVRGAIGVRLERAGENAVSVSVRDEGNGLPDGFDIERSRGFGMTIIRAFLQQSGAKLVVRHLKPGAEFLINIPLE